MDHMREFEDAMKHAMPCWWPGPTPGLGTQCAQWAYKCLFVSVSIFILVMLYYKLNWDPAAVTALAAAMGVKPHFFCVLCMQPVTLLGCMAAYIVAESVFTQTPPEDIETELLPSASRDTCGIPSLVVSHGAREIANQIRAGVAWRLCWQVTSSIVWAAMLTVLAPEKRAGLEVYVCLFLPHQFVSLLEIPLGEMANAVRDLCHAKVKQFGEKLALTEEAATDQATSAFWAERARELMALERQLERTWSHYASWWMIARQSSHVIVLGFLLCLSFVAEHLLMSCVLALLSFFVGWKIVNNLYDVTRVTDLLNTMGTPSSRNLRRLASEHYGRAMDPEARSAHTAFMAYLFSGRVGLTIPILGLPLTAEIAKSFKVVTTVLSLLYAYSRKAFAAHES